MLGSLGNTYPDMHKRMSCHEEALRIRTEIGDRLGAARACENLAGIHELARNDLPTAIKYMEMAAKLAPDWDIMKKDYQAQLEGMRKRLE
jgi:hypothetical protein